MRDGLSQVVVLFWDFRLFGLFFFVSLLLLQNSFGFVSAFHNELCMRCRTFWGSSPHASSLCLLSLRLGGML